MIWMKILNTQIGIQAIIKMLGTTKKMDISLSLKILAKLEETSGENYHVISNGLASLDSHFSFRVSRCKLSFLNYNLIFLRLIQLEYHYCFPLL